MGLLSPDGLETPMIMGKSAPFVSAFIDTVDDAIRAHQPHHGMSAMQRAWLAFCVTAVVVTNSICWARFERASLGTGFPQLWSKKQRSAVSICNFITSV